MNQVWVIVVAAFCTQCLAAPQNSDIGTTSAFNGNSAKVITEERLKACSDSKPVWLKSDPKQMTECIVDLLGAVHNTVKNGAGLPAIGAPSMEPLFVPKATVSDSSVFTGTVTNLNVHGFSEFFLRENINVQPAADVSGLTVIKMRAPKGLKIVGLFDAVAHLLKSVLGAFYNGPPSKISGIFDGKISNPELTIRAAYVNDPDHGASVDGVQLSFNFESATVRLKNDQLVAGAMLNLVNSLLEDSELAAKVINEVTPDILRRFQAPMFNMLEDGFEQPKEILGL